MYNMGSQEFIVQTEGIGAVLSQCDDAGGNTQCLSIAGDCSPGRLGIVRVAKSNPIPSLVLSTQ